MEFASCEYVNTWGIMYLCDVYNPNEKQISPFIYLQSIDWENMKPYTKIYFNIDQFNMLFEHLMRNLRVPIYLFTGHGDSDSTLYNDRIMRVLLEDRRIIKWFSQNCITRHPKMVKIPIGLDYHTLATCERLHAWGERKSCMDQDRELQKINKDKERQMRCYANFHFNKSNIRYSKERENAIKMIPKDLVHYEDKFVNRRTTWENQTNYYFVISPFGNGLDCHRTWEALALGCYPIIKRSEINDLFIDLPVIVIDEWNEITREFLEDKLKQIQSTTYDYRKLKMEYWKEYINSLTNT